MNSGFYWPCLLSLSFSGDNLDFQHLDQIIQSLSLLQGHRQRKKYQGANNRKNRDNIAFSRVRNCYFICVHLITAPCFTRYPKCSICWRTSVNEKQKFLTKYLKENNKREVIGSNMSVQIFVGLCETLGVMVIQGK